MLKQKNLPRPLLGKEGSIYSQPLRVTSALITRSVQLVLTLAKAELEGVLLLKQKNLPRPLLSKEGRNKPPTLESQTPDWGRRYLTIKCSEPIEFIL